MIFLFLEMRYLHKYSQNNNSLFFLLNRLIYLFPQPLFLSVILNSSSTFYIIPSPLSLLIPPTCPTRPTIAFVLIANILNSPSPLIHYTFTVSLAQPAFLAFSLSRGVKPFFVFLIGIKDKMVTSSSVSSSGSSSSSSSWVLFQVTSLT